MMRFLCDQMLQELGRWLRIAGYDTVIITESKPDRAILDEALSEGRTLLTRDSDFPKLSGAAGTVIYIHSNSLEECVQELTQKLPLNWLHAPFTRCLTCNTPLIPAPSTEHTHEKLCPTCNHLFWEGSHTTNMLRQLERWSLHLLFINGLSCTPEVWGPLTPLRSRYPSCDANTTDYPSMEGMAHAAKELIAPTRPTCVIGFSMGGFVALLLALSRPPGLKRLVLINTTGGPLNEATRPAREADIAAAKRGDLNAPFTSLQGLCFHNPTRELEALRKKMTLETGSEAYINQQRAIISRTPCMEELSAITLPTLIITADNDRIAPIQDSFQMHKAIPHSQLVVIPECGHFSPLEKGEEVLRAITAFLHE